jgi:hypothetical protein
MNNTLLNIRWQQAVDVSASGAVDSLSVPGIQLVSSFPYMGVAL